MINKIGNIDFKTFIETLDTLKKYNDWQIGISNLGINLIECSELNNVETNLVKLLSKGLNLDEKNKDEISHFCYDRDFGRYKKLGNCILNNKEYPLNTYIDLWNWLVAIQGLEDSNKIRRKVLSPDEEMIKKINKLSQTTLKITEKDVYVIKVKMIDNNLDSSKELFSYHSLLQLKEQLKGKTGYIDYNVNGKSIKLKNARIFDAEVSIDRNNLNNILEPLVSVYAYVAIPRLLIRDEMYITAPKVTGSVSCSVKNRLQLKNYNDESIISITVLDNVTDTYSWTINITD